MPGLLTFEDPPGDCHIKFGRMRGEPFYLVKIASSGYQNERLGIPVSDGVVIALSSETGSVKTILLDEGWLTAWRTAAAGALAAQALSPPELGTIGIFGAGLQARLQLEWLKQIVGCRCVVAWARRPDKLAELCQDLEKMGFDARAASKRAEVVQQSQLIVTATAAKSPLFASEHLQPGTHITAVGADSPGKQELDPECFARAACIATDDHAECLAFGEFSNAVQAGVVARNADISLGSILAGDVTLSRLPSDITIVDLTGVAAQDAAIAAYVARKLGTLEPANLK
jgi:ornithine cyclodeaminase/alanine dehydrogenase-like protein (mu-crystallin family)